MSDGLDLEYRKLCAATALEHAVAHFVRSAEARQEGRGDDELDEIEQLQRYVGEMPHGEVEDMFYALLDLSITKQWALRQLRRDCPCAPCRQSRALTEGA